MLLTRRIFHCHPIKTQNLKSRLNSQILSPIKKPNPRIHLPLVLFSLQHLDFVDSRKKIKKNLQGKEREVMDRKKLYDPRSSQRWADKCQSEQLEDVMDHKRLYESRRSQRWVDKYRPKQLKDVKHQSNAVSKLVDAIKSNKGHIYLYGKLGVGKTSTVKAIAKHIFSCPVYYQSSSAPLLTLLTSIKKFVEAGSSGHNWCSPSMLIIIDSAQDIGEDYLKSLRPLMGKAFSRNVRFIFKCDCFPECKCIGQHKRLIGPLADICESIGFKSLPNKYVESSLWDICSKEELSVDPEAIPIICLYANGSLGWAITFLQRSARSFRSTIYPDDLDVNVMFGPVTVFAEQTKRLISVCKLNEFKSVMETINNIIYIKRVDVRMFLSELYDVVVEAKDISDRWRNRVCDYLVEVDKRLHKSENPLHEVEAKDISDRWRNQVSDCVVEADKRFHKSENPRHVMLDVAGTLKMGLLEISEDQVERFWWKWNSYYPSIEVDKIHPTVEGDGYVEATPIPAEEIPDEVYQTILETTRF